MEKIEEEQKPTDKILDGLESFTPMNLSPYIEQKPTEWSENESNLLDSIIEDYEKANRSFCGYDGKIGLLKAIRSGEYNLPKQEWSEEDEEIREKIIDDLCALKDWIIKYDTNWLSNPILKNIGKQISWLKSLRTKPHWKPSEEQMKALLYCTLGENYDVHALVRLFAELKNL